TWYLGAPERGAAGAAPRGHQRGPAAPRDRGHVPAGLRGRRPRPGCAPHRCPVARRPGRAGERAVPVHGGPDALLPPQSRRPPPPPPRPPAGPRPAPPPRRRPRPRAPRRGGPGPPPPPPRPPGRGRSRAATKRYRSATLGAAVALLVLGSLLAAATLPGGSPP